MPSKLPKFKNFLYISKKRLWVSVDRVNGQLNVGKLDDPPISKGIQYDDPIQGYKNILMYAQFEDYCSSSACVISWNRVPKRPLVSLFHISTSMNV